MLLMFDETRAHMGGSGRRHKRWWQSLAGPPFPMLGARLTSAGKRSQIAAGVSHERA